MRVSESLEKPSEEREKYDASTMFSVCLEMIRLRNSLEVESYSGRKCYRKPFEESSLVTNQTCETRDYDALITSFIIKVKKKIE